MEIIFCIPWADHQLGVDQRENSYSLHLTRADAEQFASEQLLEKNELGSDDFRPDCDPYPIEPINYDAAGMETMRQDNMIGIWMQSENTPNPL